jgi:hypothetical protein
VERFAGGWSGEVLTGCAGVDDGEMGAPNDEAGGEACVVEAVEDCVAAAMAAAEPATIGGAAAAKVWPAEFDGADDAVCGIKPGGGDSDDGAHCPGGACKLGGGKVGGADANDVAGGIPCGGTIGVPLRAFAPGGY